MFIQLMPIVVLILVSILSQMMVSPPPYSLYSRPYEHTHTHTHTQILSACPCIYFKFVDLITTRGWLKSSARLFENVICRFNDTMRAARLIDHKHLVNYYLVWVFFLSKEKKSQLRQLTRIQSFLCSFADFKKGHQCVYLLQIPLLDGTSLVL